MIIMWIKKANRTWFLTTTAHFEWMPTVIRHSQGIEVWFLKLYLAIDTTKGNDYENLKHRRPDKG